MKIIESLKIKEKAYVETLENGLKIIIVPKKIQIKIYNMGRTFWIYRQSLYNAQYRRRSIYTRWSSTLFRT